MVTDFFCDIVDLQWCHFSLAFLGQTEFVWSLDVLKGKSNNIIFLVIFLILSVVVSFFMGWVWAKWIQPFQMKLINKVRKQRGVASFSDNSSVWDEVFGKDDEQVVEIGKINKEEDPIIGSITKASRTFEPERYLNLEDVDFFTDLVKEHKIPVRQILYDAKTGVYIKIFDPDGIKKHSNKCYFFLGSVEEIRALGLSTDRCSPTG